MCMVPRGWAGLWSQAWPWSPTPWLKFLLLLIICVTLDECLHLSEPQLPQPRGYLLQSAAICIKSNKTALLFRLLGLGFLSLIPKD